MGEKRLKQKKEKETKIDAGIKSAIKNNVPLMLAFAILAILFVVLYYLFQSFGKIEYQDMTFTRERLGEILVYRYSYFTQNSQGKFIENTLYVRNDPRTNNVPISGKIEYPFGRQVFISINSTGLNLCEDSGIALATLTLFLGSNEIKPRVGTPDKEEALARNQSHITCDKYVDNMVISIRESQGNETKIYREGNYCYRIDVASCEIQKAVEKFVVHSIIDARGF